MVGLEYKKILEWNREHAMHDDSLFTMKLVKAGLTYRQISSVLDAVDTTCNHCWDAEYGCQCWNDD